MHDPLVVAHVIVRPWPQRTAFSATGSRGDGVRWRMRLRHDHTSSCLAEDPPHASGPLPWWRPRSYSHFWRVAGRDWYWPPLVTVWHCEPGGRDSGEVCRHVRTVIGKDHKLLRKPARAWRWHVHHWRIQVHPAQHLRRALLTRCAWCHGRSTRTDPVNHSRGSSRQPARWWQGERDLFHSGCLEVERAHGLCFCARPDPSGPGYGQCHTCGKFRPWRYQPDAADQLLAALPAGSPIPDEMRPRIDALWAERRARSNAAADCGDGAR